MIREAATIAITEDAGEPGADDHAGERHRNEIGIHRRRRPADADQCGEHRSLQIDLEGIEEHAAADQAKHSIMETGCGKAIEPRAGVDSLHGSSQGAVFLSGQVFGRLI